MKQIIFVILIAFFTIALTKDFYSQRREISKEEFLQHYNRMLAKTESLPRRITFIFEHFVKDSKIKFEPQKTIIEIVPKDKMYIYSVFGNRTSEKIYIGNTEYKKQNNGWTRIENSEPKLLLWNNLPLNLEGVRWFGSENTSLDGQKTILFEYIIEKISEDKNPSQKTENFSSAIEQKFWVNNENLLIKSERNERNERPQSNNFKFTYSYEHDPKIKIEAPTK